MTFSRASQNNYSWYLINLQKQGCFIFISRNLFSTALGNTQNMKPIQFCTGFIFCTIYVIVTAYYTKHTI